MAGVLNEKERLKLHAAQQAASQATDTPAAAIPTATPAAGTAAAPAASPATGTAATTALKGVSEGTASKLNQYSQGYQQSGSVQAAQNYLNAVLNKKPVADTQLSQLYDRIMNREQFSYDLNGDALYQQYKDRYQNLGRQAMMDTMGNATALTGGYGSSYATTAGNQAYQQYLQQLNDVVPELYQQAYNRYTQEGNDLLNQYNMAYGQYRDAVGDWENERSYANSDYWQRYGADYADYQNQFNYWNQMAQQENANYYTDRDYAYNLAMAIIDKRKMPSDEILAAAGMTQADAQMLGARVSRSSSSSSKKSSSSSSTSSTAGLSGYAQRVLSSSQQLLDRGVSQTQVLDRVSSFQNYEGAEGRLTATEAQTIKKILTGK